MPRIVIIHGTGGTPEGNWFPWLAGRLTAAGHDVVIPRMPTPEGQSLDVWLAAFSSQVGVVDDRTVVVGHSIGATFLLRVLERLEHPLYASVFVAGLTGKIGIPEFDTLNSSFIAGSYDWSHIRQNAGRVLCFSGDNDPYVPVAQGLEIAEGVGVSPLLVTGGRHLNAEAGYTTFPLLLEHMDELLRAHSST